MLKQLLTDHKPVCSKSTARIKENMLFCTNQISINSYTTKHDTVYCKISIPTILVINDSLLSITYLV